MPRADVEIFFSTSAPTFAYPQGASIAGQSSAVSASGQSNQLEAAISGAEVSAESGSVVFSEQLYPLTATSRISNPNFGQTTALDDRDAIGLMDASLLHGFFASNMEPPVSAGYLPRTAVSQDILNSHPTSKHHLCTYFNMMEKSDNGDALAIKIGSETGPNGTDWWCRDGSGAQYSFFAGSFGVNISNYSTPDSGGQLYPTYYADNFIQTEYVDVHAAAGIGVGEGGVNCFLDNFQLYSNKSGCDWNQAGGPDGSRLHYDSEIPEHVSGDAVAVTAYSAWRANHMRGLQRIRENNPGIFVLPNTNQWANSSIIFDGAPVNNAVPDNINALRTVILEYRLGGDTGQADVQGGFSEKNISDNFPTSGVNQYGLYNNTGGSWKVMYNKAYQAARFCQEPKIVFATGAVNCLQNGTSGSGGRTIWSPVPASNAVWHLFRWMHCTYQIAGAHTVVSGREVANGSAGRAASTPLFDEYGVINGSVDYGFGTGNTKLFHKWMGIALEAAPTTPLLTHGTGEIWAREFENALCIVNTDNRQTNTAATIPVSLLPGGASEWMFFNGDQDAANNDGSYASVDFTIEPIDGFVLVRRSWYEAL